MVRPYLSANTWAGYVNMSIFFGVSLQCPLGYCNLNELFFCSSSTRDHNMNISNSKTCDKKTRKSLCLHYHEGQIKCGIWFYRM